MPDNDANVVALVDLHWSGSARLRLPDLTGVDLVLLGGDLTHFQGSPVAGRLLHQVYDAGARTVLAVCGNCDQRDVEDELKLADVALDCRMHESFGVRFLGLSGGLPFGGCPYERSEEEFAASCRGIWSSLDPTAAKLPTVLVPHQPPHGTRCDRARGGRHVGSHAIRRAIEDHQPDLVICGHIHESIGSDTIGQSRIVNPGPWINGHYARFRIREGAIGEVELL